MFNRPPAGVSIKHEDRDLGQLKFPEGRAPVEPAQDQSKLSPEVQQEIAALRTLLRSTPEGRAIEESYQWDTATMEAGMPSITPKLGPTDKPVLRLMASKTIETLSPGAFALSLSYSGSADRGFIYIRELLKDGKQADEQMSGLWFALGSSLASRPIDDRHRELFQTSVLLHEIHHTDPGQPLKSEFYAYKKQFEFLANHGIIRKPVSDEFVLSFRAFTSDVKPYGYQRELRNYQRSNPGFSREPWLPGGREFNCAIQLKLEFLETFGGEKEQITKLQELLSKGYESELGKEYLP